MTTPPPASPPPLPPPPPPTPPGDAPFLPPIDWRRVVSGNWLGSATVAGLTVVTAGVLGLVVALLVKPPDFGVGHTLDLATAVATGAFGADLTASGEYDDAEFSGSLGMFPLTLTVVVVAVLLLTFRRMIRDYPGPRPALADAARVAALVGLGLMVPAIIFRGDNTEFGRGWGTYLDDDYLGVDIDYGVSVAGALFLGFFVVLVLLGLVVLLRRAWWPERVQRVHDWVAAPLYGYLTIFWLLPLVGLVGFLLLGFGEESLQDIEEESSVREVLTVVVTLLASGGVWMMSIGSGAAFGYHGEADGESDEDDYEHLWGTITDDEPGLWAAPVILLLVLAVAAYVVVRRSPSKRHALGNLMAWVGGLVVFVPLLVRLSSLHGSGEADDGLEEYDLGLVVGPEGVQTTSFVLGIALVVALLVAAVTGTLDLAAVRAKLSTLQTHPGAPPPSPPPPAGYPPSGPPSGPPPSGPPPSGPPPSWSPPS